MKALQETKMGLIADMPMTYENVMLLRVEYRAVHGLGPTLLTTNINDYHTLRRDALPDFYMGMAVKVDDELKDGEWYISATVTTIREMKRG